MYPVSSQTTVACCHWGILIVTLIHLKYFSLPYTLIKLFEACGAIYKSATKPALNSLHEPYRFLWTAFFFTPGPLALCVTKRIREKLWKRIVQGTFLPTFSLPEMEGWVSLFITTLLLQLGFAMSSNSFSEESVKIMHLTYAKVGVGGSKTSPQ